MQLTWTTILSLDGLRVKGMHIPSPLQETSREQENGPDMLTDTNNTMSTTGIDGYTCDQVDRG